MPAGGRALYRAREEERDQSYFLFGTTREQLDMLRFPLGERAKAETRELARKFGLAIADKHDSQDICFVPTGHYADIIERLKPGAAEAGDIVDLDGKVLGAHDGIIHFTVGQRRGLGVAAGAPLYVVRLDAERRRVVVGPREALRTSRIVLRDVNWIGDGAHRRSARPTTGREVFVKVRSTRPPQAAGCVRPPRRLRSRTGRRRARRLARPGLRVLRCGRRPGARARRRLHQERGGGGDMPRMRAMSAWRRSAREDKLLRMGATSTSKRRARLRALGAGLRPRVRRGVRARPAARDRRGRAGLRPAGGRILEVGVGTGISLPDYARINRLVGIDLSEPMLRKAQERVVEHKLTNVEALAVMDAERLALPDIFDVVVAQYVITAVPDPEATLDEFVRVIKPGGEIILVNHIGAEAGPRRVFELGFAPLARRLGWRPEFRFGRLDRLGRAPRRRAPDRAPADAADGAFLAHPLRAPGLVLGRLARNWPKWPSWRGFSSCLLEVFAVVPISRPGLKFANSVWRGSSAG